MSLQNLKPMSSAPRDGTPILLYTSSGFVEAYFCPGEWTEHHEYGRQYSGAFWSCFDDIHQCEVEEIPSGGYYDHGCLGWLDLPIVTGGRFS